MKDEFLVLLKYRLGIWTCRIDPEFEHAARAGERAGNSAVTLDLARIANVDDHDVAVMRELDGVRGAYGFDLRIGLVDQRLDAVVNGLGMELPFRVILSSSIPGLRCAYPGKTTLPH